MRSILGTASLDISKAGFDILSVWEQGAIIEVRHAANWFGLHRSIEVSIDGYRVGSVGRKTPGRYRVAPGRHTLEARMDWCRTQSVSIDMDANERAVFHFSMERFYSRVWTLAVIVLGMLYAAWGISNGLAWTFPWLSSLPRIVIGYFGIPCLLVLGVCELIVFSRARPWSPPGHLFRLIRHPAKPELPEGWKW